MTRDARLDREKVYFYDRFADRFDGVMNMYDTRRRVEIIFDDLLAGEGIAGKRLLDAGAGTGWFSQAAAERGARVISLDVGSRLLSKVAEKCRSARVVGSIMDLNLRDHSLDIVISSEVIEHTPDPRRAVSQLCRALKPGGVLVLTVPNRIWRFSAQLANALGVRPYEGFENWVRWGELRRWLTEDGLTIEVYRGLHLFPFILPWTHPFLRWCDQFGQRLGPVMLNIVVKARKH